MTPDSLAFEVVGVPAPQGSKDQFGRESSARVKPWRERVHSAALDALDAAQWPLLPFGDADVALTVSFAFARPASHYGTGRNAETLKPSAPGYPTSRRCGDLDKLLRAVMDALTGVAYTDDAKVASETATKLWVHRGVSPVTEVTVVRMP